MPPKTKLTTVVQQYEKNKNYLSGKEFLPAHMQGMQSLVRVTILSKDMHAIEKTLDYFLVNVVALRHSRHVMS